MNDRPTPIRRTLRRIALATGLCILIPTSAYADVFGRLHFSVKDAADEKPLASAHVTLHDLAGVRADIQLTTDATGNATSPLLETRAWQTITHADTYEDDTRQVTIAGDTSTDVEVLLEPLKEKVIKITGQQILVRKGQTANVARRDQNFINKFPVTAGNRQNLGSVLLTNPGFVQSSVNQVHPRGEHGSTTIFINGFELPGVLQGRAGAFLSPEAIQSADIMTGAYSPEYGSETAAILNLNLRSGPIKPITDFTVDGGSFSTYDGSLTLGGQGGAAIGLPNANGVVNKRFGYFVNLSARSTANALEPPQPDKQTAHNAGTSSTLFGNFDYKASDRDQFTLTVNGAPANTEVANRTGLPNKFASLGQGYGYGGVLSAAEAAAEGIKSQQDAGQDIYQKDDNKFGVLNYRHSFNDQLTGLLSYGQTRSTQNIKNNNPSVNLASLPADSSIEFNPDLDRSSTQNQLQGSLTSTQGTHTYKAGFVLDDQKGNESYQFIPASQLALDALYATDPRLAPSGTLQVDAQGNAVLDSQGNQVYQINPANTKVPTLKVHRSGYYRAAYVQDTWNANRKLTINYGLRLDAYRQSESISTDSVSKTDLSPRFNLAYALAPRTIGRLSYNHLFTEPPLAQGAILGNPIIPETINQYEGSIEKQIAQGQTVKLAYYYKNIRNQDDTGLLIPGTQIGVFTTVNIERAGVHGFELSYDLAPRNNVGLGGFLAYTNSLAKPSGVTNTGEEVEAFNDHDQLNTVSAGVNYTGQSGASVGLSVYHGSGEASSAIDASGDRTPHTSVNLRLDSGPHLLKVVTLGLNVENLFDSREVLNFNSGFSGTRFQQGRRVLLTATGSF